VPYSSLFYNEKAATEKGVRWTASQRRRYCRLYEDLEVTVAALGAVVALDAFLLTVGHLGDALEVPALSGATLVLETVDRGLEVELDPRVIGEVLELDGQTGVDASVGVSESGNEIPLVRTRHDVVELIAE